MSSPISKKLPEQYYDQKDGTNVCFLCGNPRYKKVYTIKHYGFPFTFYQCECGLIKQAPMPNEAFFEWFFNNDIFFSSKQTNTKHIWGYYDYFSDEPNRMATSKWRYKRMRHIFENGKPLDVMKIGPATGTFLFVAKERGHHVRGCDVSSQFREYARTNYHVEIDHGRFEKQPYADGQFDAILLLNVIENVPNQDEFLKAITRTLKRGGYFIFNYVEMKSNLIEIMQKDRYFIYRPPVCYAYTQDAIQKILDKYGFVMTEKFNDQRMMNVEKVFSLLGWYGVVTLARKLKLNRVSFPIYAYPSKVVIARKQ